MAGIAAAWPLACTRQGMVIHDVDGMPDGVLLRQYRHRAIAHASYLLIDVESGTAVVMDPVRDVDPYLEDALAFGARIKHVFLTQLHDDFTTGHAELRDRALATVYAGAWSHTNAPFMLLKDGDAFEFGRLRLRIAEVPGRRLESLMLLASDLRSGDPAPFAVFTGETLLNGDIGRPSPLPGDAYGLRELAVMLWDSLRRQVLTLADRVRIFPAHTGEVDDQELRPDTMEAQRSTNPGLRDLSRDVFVRRVTLGMAEESMLDVKRIPLRAGTADELLRAQRAGAQLVDDRDPADFSAGSLEGSINIPAASAFESWASGVLDPARPIVLVSSSGRDGITAARLVRAGFTGVGAYLGGGMESIAERGNLLRTYRRLAFSSLGMRIMRGGALLLDTRASGMEEGPGVCAFQVSLERLRQDLPSIPRVPEIIVLDDTPYRSSAAASFLRAQGFDRVTEAAGGLALWGRQPS